MEGLGQAIALAPIIVMWLFFAAASARLAHLKNIPISVGLLLGALLGLFGFVIMVCLPSNRKTAPGGPPPGW
jgi:pilus assembly protein TadC